MKHLNTHSSPHAKIGPEYAQSGRLWQVLFNGNILAAVTMKVVTYMFWLVGMQPTLGMCQGQTW